MIVGIVNYGAGNITSVANAVRWTGHESVFVKNKSDLDKVSALILPGVGAFGHAMARLTDLNLVDPLREWATAGKPLLGICLGMQLLGQGSEEGGWSDGLHIVSGTVSALGNLPGIRIPHMGWNEVTRVKPGVLWGDAERIVVYHVHGYHMIFATPEEEKRWLSGVCVHGSRLASMIEADNVMGTQFHPEKSQRDGLLVLQNFFKASEKC